MKVDIFSDVVCPWCAVGKRRFEKALAQFPHHETVTVQWRAFELDPTAPSSQAGDSATHLANKYGMSKDEALARQQQLADIAALDGLDFHFETTKRGNSFDAHRLLHFAHEVGLQDELKERLFVANFTESEAIGDRATLVRLGAEVGLDAEKCAEVLESDRYGDDVRADEQQAREFGISGVPYFVIDNQYGISGAQSADAMLQVLNQAWAAQHPHLVETSESGDSCDGDTCVI